MTEVGRGMARKSFRGDNLPSGLSDNTAQSLDLSSPVKRGLFARVARFSFRYWFVNLAVFGLLFVAACYLVFGGPLVKSLQNHGLTTIQGSPSSKAEALAAKKFADAGDTGIIYFHSDSLTADDPAYRSAVFDVLNKMEQADPDAVGAPMTYYESQELLRKVLLSPDQKTQIAQVPLYGNMESIARSEEVLQKVAASASSGQVSVEFMANTLITHDMIKAVGEEATQALVVAAIILAIVLLLATANFVALIPLLGMALMSLVLSMGAAAFVGQWTDMELFGVGALALICLALGTDFTLFIYKRYKTEYSAGRAPIDAMSIAAQTEGRLACYGALVAAAAVTPLLLLPSTVFRSFALAAIAAFVVLAAMVTFLIPAVLAVFGRLILHANLPWSKFHLPAHQWRIAKFFHFGFKHHGFTIAFVLVTLLVLAVPAIAMLPATGSVDLLPKGLEARQTAEKVQKAFVPGMVAPITGIVEATAPVLKDVATFRSVSSLQQKIAEDPDTFLVVGPATVVDAVAGNVPALDNDTKAKLKALQDRDLGALQAPAQPAPPLSLEERSHAETDSKLQALDMAEQLLPGVARQIENLAKGNYGKFLIIGRPAPQSTAAESYLARLKRYSRDIYGEAKEGGFNRHGQVYFGGAIASGLDVAHTTRTDLPPVLLLIAVILLIGVVLALRAVRLAMLVVAAEIGVMIATYGLLVVAFQWGWLKVIGLQDLGFIEAEIPILLLPVALGLSTAYLLLLCGRIADFPAPASADEDFTEHFVGHITHMSRVGYAGSAVMLVLFASMWAYGSALLQQLGFAFSVLVVLDLVLVRGLLMPAAFGRWGAALWRQPIWLSKLPGVQPKRTHADESSFAPSGAAHPVIPLSEDAQMSA